jgi:HPt (histidine-containing phosphotransfer) domain-containing protein
LLKWIPAGKRKIPLPTDIAPDVSPLHVEDPLFRIDGIDAAQGLSRAGGKREAYARTLEFFRKDAQNSLESVRSLLNRGDYQNFTIQIHALKSASGSVGALGLAEQAAELESSARNGDFDFIRTHMENFEHGLTRTLESINCFLRREKSQSRNAKDVSQPDAEFFSDLALLRHSFENTDTSGIDRIINRLQTWEAGGDIQDALEKISKHFLQVEYDEAIAVIDTLAARYGTTHEM